MTSKRTIVPSQSQTVNPRQVVIRMDGWNPAEYAAPWIARATFASGEDRDYGAWAGPAGGTGQLEVPAQPGDIVVVGQPTLDGADSPEYLLVQGDGDLTPLGHGLAGQQQASRVWRASHDGLAQAA